MAQSEAQAQALWFLRANLSQAQTKEGASIKHDISIPLNDWADFTKTALRQLEAFLPDIRPVIFGHMGDGNLHFNLTRPQSMKDEDFLAHRPQLHQLIYELVWHWNGSISAEHGIGIAKREALETQKGQVAMDMMRKIKKALDPDGVFNPDKIFFAKNEGSDEV